MSQPVGRLPTMLSRVSSVALVGMEARPVEVEVDVAQGGIREFHIVGLPSAAVREARRRVRSAVINSGEEWPERKITVNLAPGDLRKEGVLLDLALAVGVLTAFGRIDDVRVSRYLFLGELALDGRLRPVRGALAAAVAAREAGAEGIVVPKQNASESALVRGVRVVGAETLTEALAFTAGELDPSTESPKLDAVLARANGSGPDLKDVRGQALARRALEIAAAGGHNLLMVGPPGAGKTMLARRLPGILPPMTRDEALEVTHVWSVAGLLPPGEPIIAMRPFRAPHHHASPPAIIGGGSPYPRPGELSLAHNGVLFLDEIPFFSRAIIEGLRQPIEDGVVTVARLGATVRFPARVSVVAAANPCPCGRLGDAGAVCTCAPGRFAAYRSRLSGPLLDRFDLHVEVPRLSEAELLDLEPAERSADVRARVIAARDLRVKRERTNSIEQRSNGTTASEGEMEAQEYFALSSSARAFLREALAREPASARAMQRMLRVARTIADLEGSDGVGEQHLAEAMQFRRAVWES